MTILQINKFFFLRGGAERYFFDLSELLAQKGHQVVPFAMHHPENRDTPYARFFPTYVDFERPRGGLAGLKVAVRMWWSREAAEKLDLLLQKVKPDVAHLHNIYHQLSPSILPVLQRHKVPVVMTMHDFNLISPNYNLCHDGRVCESFRWSWMSAVRHRCVKNSLTASLLAALEVRRNRERMIYERHVDRFLAPSQFMKDMHARWEFPVGKMEVVPLFAKSPGSRAQNPDGSVLFTGRLYPEKGLDVLLKAAANLPETKFKIAGTGPMEQKLKKIASANVVFLGKLTGVQVSEELSRSSIAVLPSVCYENFPLAIVEAMVAGLPVVASRIGGIPELVRDEETGLLFTPGDANALANAIRRLVKDPAQARAMGEKGQAIAQSEYGPEKHYERIMQIYNSFSGSRRLPARHAAQGAAGG